MKTVTQQHIEYVECLEQTVSHLINDLCLALRDVPGARRTAIANQSREQLLKLNNLCEFEFGDSNSMLFESLETLAGRINEELCRRHNESVKNK